MPPGPVELLPVSSGGKDSKEGNTFIADYSKCCEESKHSEVKCESSVLSNKQSSSSEPFRDQHPQPTHVSRQWSSTQPCRSHAGHPRETHNRGCPEWCDSTGPEKPQQGFLWRSSEGL